MPETTLAPWRPIRQFTTLRDSMDRLFEETVRSFFRPSLLSDGMGTGIPMDIYEEGDRYVLEAALPGARPEDVDISLQGNTLTVRAKVPAPSDEGRVYLLQELCPGEFSRTVTLPAEVDANKVDALFEHGILRLTLPKTPAYQAKRIPVKSAK